MKCKVSEGLCSDVGPPSTALPTTRLHKEGPALPHTHLTSDKNEGSALRRSSRRATIERRVWAIPKKTTKTVKDKSMQKPAKKENEKKTDGKLHTKTANAVKVSLATKRSHTNIEDGNPQKKVKKKEKSGISAKQKIENVHKITTEKMEIVKSFESAGKRKMEVKECSGEVKRQAVGDSSLECAGEEVVCGDATDVRTSPSRHVPHVADCKKLSVRTNNTSREILEETLCTDELCPNKAVVEEVVPDYANSLRVRESEGSGDCAVKEEENPAHSFRNLEDVLGHSYSKVKPEDSDEPGNIFMPQNSLHSIEKSDDKEVKDIQEVKINQEELQSRDRNDVHGDESITDDIRHSSEDTSQENVLGFEISNEKDVTKSLTKNATKLIISNATPTATTKPEIYTSTTQPEVFATPAVTENGSRNCDVGVGVGTEMVITDPVDPSHDMAQEVVYQEEEEDHVSLSVALAQLVDSEGMGEAEGAPETVTIHSAASPIVPMVEDAEAAHQTVLSVKVPQKELEPQAYEAEEECVEDEEGELVIKEDDDKEEEEEEEEEEEDRNSMVSEEEHSTATVVSTSGNNAAEDRGDGSVREESADEASQSCPANNHQDSTDSVATSPSPTPPKVKKQIPPLIKINSRPPAIKTPLKCPECPMQFCTVRSLLWHFGIHGARSSDSCLPPILLQDLIVPWDQPTMSLLLTPTDADKGTEKVYSAEAFVPISSSTDAAPKLDGPLQIIRTEDYMGTNGDVILKVPIPRLKPKPQACSGLKKDKFVNILPKTFVSDGQPSASLQNAEKFVNILPKITPSDGKATLPTTPKLARITSFGSSPAPKIKVDALNSKPDIVSIQPQPLPVPKMNIKASDNLSNQVQIKPVVSSPSAVHIQPLISTSQPAIQIQPLISKSGVQFQPLISSSESHIQIQPLVSSSNNKVQIQPVTKTTKSSTSAGHITFIPVDSIPSVGRTPNPKDSKVNPSSIRMMAPSSLNLKASTPVEGILEKDGLVMINSNLALRIVSSLPSSVDSTVTTNTTTIRPISSHLGNNLTIMPQGEATKLFNTKKESTKNPDILTIVPQVDVNKKVSLLKPSASTTNSPGTSAASAAGSQVVKLYLLQPKDTKPSGDNMVKLNIASDQKNHVNGFEIPMPYASESIVPISDAKDSKSSVVDNGGEDEQEEEDEEEMDDEEDEGMVIDDEKGDDDIMDPLSLCAVTMEDENLEAASGHFSDTSPSPSEDKVTIKKIISLKAKGKNNQGVDMEKYEARKYVCHFCNRRFGWSTDLKRHVILHTGEKPFQCKVCPTAFTRKFLLQNHMKRMHPDKCKMSDLWP